MKLILQLISSKSLVKNSMKTNDGSTLKTIPKLKKWVISMEEDQERYERFQKQAPIHGMGVQKWTSFRMTPGQKGLGLAYKTMFKQALERGEGCLLTFEDDCQFTHPYAIDWFWKAYQDLPPHWDVYLGGAFGTDLEDTESPNIKKCLEFSGTHMALWSYNAMNTIVKFYDPEVKSNRSHIDRFIGNPFRPFSESLEEWRLNVYVCDPIVAVQEVGVQSRIGGGIVPDRFRNSNKLETDKQYRDITKKMARWKIISI